MEKFLLISQVFYPDEVSTAGLFTNLCVTLIEENTSVEVWCAQPSYNILKRQPSKVTYRNVNIHFLPSTNFPKSNLVGRLINYLTFSISLTIKLILSREKSMIVTHTTPPSLGILIAFLCRLKRRKFTYVLLDILPEGLIRLGKISPRSILTKFWEHLNLYTLKKSTKIIVIGRDMQEWLHTKVPTVYKKTAYIPLWQDAELIHPLPLKDNSFVQEINLYGKFIVQYSGNMGLWQDMKSLGEAAMKITDPDIQFVFIGDGMRKKELLDSFGGNVPTNTLLLPFQPRKKIGNTLTACHIALISLAGSLEGMSVPSKIYGILAAGVPIVASVPGNSEIALIVMEENCGLVTEPGNAEKLVEAIEFLKNAPKERTLMGMNARKAFERKYTVKIIAEKYKQFLFETGGKVLKDLTPVK